MKQAVPRRLGAASGIGLSALLMAACGTGGATSSSGSGSVTAGPGVNVSAKTITIGILDALSGPAAALGQPGLAGYTAFWDGVNAGGGIDGWKVNLVTKDEAYNPTQHVQQFQAIKGQIALLDSFGSPTTLAIQQQVDQMKLVTAPLSWDSIWGADPVMAPVGTPYAFDVANALDYLSNAGTKPLKVGIIYQNDAYGTDGVRGYTAAVSAYGLTDVGQEPFNVTDTDYLAQVQKLKTGGAQVVIVTAIPSSSGPIIGTAATLGFSPTWVLQGPSFIEELMTKDGTATATPTPIAPALKGAYVAMFCATWGDTSVPGMAQMIADHDKYEMAQAPSIYFTWAYADAKMQAAILKKACLLYTSDAADE